jgi:beta-lactamase class A
MSNIVAPISEPLQKVLEAVVQSTVTHFAAQNLRSDQLAVTLIELQDPKNPKQASYRGDIGIYPASVIKLFYLAAAHRWMEDKKIEDTPELRRAMRDMIVDSYNEATGYVIDLLTGTTSGPELPAKDIEEWWDKRNAVNRYFASENFTTINVNKKPWCEGPYGRETQAIKLFTPKRNQLTTDAAARLMFEIVQGRAVSAERSQQMMELLHRNLSEFSTDPDNQSRGFIGPAVPTGGRMWSKAGWMSEVRHDCAYLELPDGRRIVMVIFTAGHSNERTIIAKVAEVILGNWPK